MKTRVCIFLLVICVAPLALGNPADSGDALLARVREAIVAKAPDQIDALTYREGMREPDLAMLSRSSKMLVEMAGEIEAITLKPLPAEFRTGVVMNNKKIEMTAAPDGMIHIQFKPGTGNVAGSSTPYARVGDGFYLVGPRSSDLNWEGPPDRNIGYGLSGTGQENVSISLKWNASGVDQARETTEPSSTFWGQHIDSVTVVSTSDDTDLTLTISENGETIHTSEPLKGKGTLQYSRKP